MSGVESIGISDGVPYVYDPEVGARPETQADRDARAAQAQAVSQSQAAFYDSTPGYYRLTPDEVARFSAAGNAAATNAVLQQMEQARGLGYQTTPGDTVYDGTPYPDNVFTSDNVSWYYWTINGIVDFDRDAWLAAHSHPGPSVTTWSPMGIYNDGAGNLWFGPPGRAPSDSSWDDFFESATTALVAVSAVFGAGAAAGLGVGGGAADGAVLGAEAAPEVAPVGDVGLDASTGQFAGETTESGLAGTGGASSDSAILTTEATPEATGVDASTGQYAGETADSGAAGAGSDALSGSSLLSQAQNLLKSAVGPVLSALRKKPAVSSASAGVAPAGADAGAAGGLSPLVFVAALLAAAAVLHS